MTTYQLKLCKKCGAPIDIETIRFIRLTKPDREATICGTCMLVAFDNLFIEATSEPLFPENWEVIRPKRTTGRG